MMFKNYKDICDVVSLLVYCPAERSYLVTKESNGEFWIPCSKSEKNCWKFTAHKIHFELLGMDMSSECSPIRIYKVWLPNHRRKCVYHAVYKVAVKADAKKKAKLKPSNSKRLQWLTSAELERQRAHANLRSPELALFAQLASGNVSKDNEMDVGMIVEICEDNVVVGCDVAGGAVALTAPHCQLLKAANYSREDQVLLYREFLCFVFPALYMSPKAFTRFMLDGGWQRSFCPGLFRAADISNRGGLSFVEVLLWTATLEPETTHEGVAAEIRCRYIFRYFDGNHDCKLEYVELKELMAAVRTACGLAADSLSVAKDSDQCLRELGLSSAAPLPMSDFLRWAVQECPGASALLRAPVTCIARLRDLNDRTKSSLPASKESLAEDDDIMRNMDVAKEASETARVSRASEIEYKLATCVVHFRRDDAPEFRALHSFDEEAVSSSTSRLMSLCTNSLDLLGDSAVPSEVFAAVHFFASAIDKPVNRRVSGGGSTATVKGAYSWAEAGEGAALGARLLRLAERVRPLCLEEPRLLMLSSPVYAIGDLHGNLAALLAMEAVLWPKGTALMSGDLLFLGDYVDRGPHGTELLAYLFAAKIQRPDAIHLIRGNHETREIQKMFTFHTECIDKYGEVEGSRIWNAVNDVFDVLPLAAIVDQKVFCCHGGIPPPWVCPVAAGVCRVPVPLPRPDDQSALAWELLWNDPVDESKAPAAVVLELNSSEGFARNWRRGVGHVFSARALKRFLKNNRLSAVIRAHQLHPTGFMVQLGGRLVSLFSSSHYCGGNNSSGVALLQRSTIRLMRVDD